MNDEHKISSLGLKNEIIDEHSSKTNPFSIHPVWLYFIKFCESLRYGEIANLKIHDGLPALAEEVRKKTAFIKLRKKALDQDGNASDKENQRPRGVNTYDNPKFHSESRIYPHLQDEQREKFSEREIINLLITCMLSDRKVPLKKIICQLEKMILVEALYKFNCNQKEVAKALSIKPSTLSAKIKKYDIRYTKNPM